MATRTPRTIALEKGVNPSNLAAPPRVEGELPAGRPEPGGMTQGTPAPNPSPIKGA